MRAVVDVIFFDKSHETNWLATMDLFYMHKSHVYNSKCRYSPSFYDQRLVFLAVLALANFEGETSL